MGKVFGFIKTMIIGGPTRPLLEVLAELRPLRWPGVRPAQTGR